MRLFVVVRQTEQFKELVHLEVLFVVQLADDCQYMFECYHLRLHLASFVLVFLCEYERIDDPRRLTEVVSAYLTAPADPLVR